jgi:hypothetical protein
MQCDGERLCGLGGDVGNDLWLGVLLARFMGNLMVTKDMEESREAYQHSKTVKFIRKNFSRSLEV